MAYPSTKWLSQLFDTLCCSHTNRPLSLQLKLRQRMGEWERKKQMKKERKRKKEWSRKKRKWHRQGWAIQSSKGWSARVYWRKRPCSFRAWSSTCWSEKLWEIWIRIAWEAWRKWCMHPLSGFRRRNHVEILMQVNVRLGNDQIGTCKGCGVSLCLSLFLSHSLSLCLSLSLPVSMPLSLSFFPFMFLSLSYSAFLSLFLSFFLFLHLSLSLSFPHSLSVCVSFSPYLSHTQSLSHTQDLHVKAADDPSIQVSIQPRLKLTKILFWWWIRVLTVRNVRFSVY